MANLVKTRGMSSVGFRQSARWEKKHETKALARNQRRNEDKREVRFAYPITYVALGPDDFDDGCHVVERSPSPSE